VFLNCDELIPENELNDAYEVASIPEDLLVCDELSENIKKQVRF
jgi:hypothetical protein